MSALMAWLDGAGGVWVMVGLGGLAVALMLWGPLGASRHESETKDQQWCRNGRAR